MGKRFVPLSVNGRTAGAPAHTFHDEHRAAHDGQPPDVQTDGVERPTHGVHEVTRWQIAGIAGAANEHTPLARPDRLGHNLGVILPAVLPEITSVFSRE